LVFGCWGLGLVVLGWGFGLGVLRLGVGGSGFGVDRSGFGLGFELWALGWMVWVFGCGLGVELPGLGFGAWNSEWGARATRALDPEPYRGISLIKKLPPPQDHRRALGIVLLWVPEEMLFLMSEVPLYSTQRAVDSLDPVDSTDQIVRRVLMINTRQVHLFNHFVLDAV